jgi:dTDP-glucose pyrophosphorylase
VTPILNIVAPIAGRGSRFIKAGYALPKPLIPVHGMPMIEVVVNNIRPSEPHQFTFLCLQEHLDSTDLASVLEKAAPGSRAIPVRAVTEGAACTVLLARDFIDNDNPLMIANSDQWVDMDINDYLSVMDNERADGLVMTMWSDHPKWSYVDFDDNGRVHRLVEKEVVSNEATVGIYNFRRGSDFVKAADQMIAANLRVNNEFYVAPAYNQMIASGARIAIFNVGREYDGMYGMGIPTDLDKFMGMDVSRKATRADGASQ